MGGVDWEDAVDRILERDLRVVLVQEPGNLPVLETLQMASEFHPFKILQFGGEHRNLGSKVDHGTASTAASNADFPTQFGSITNQIDQNKQFVSTDTFDLN